MISGFSALLHREILLALRGGGKVLTLVLFFVIVGAIVPFAVGPDNRLLAAIAPGMVWIAAFLAMLLGIDRIFQPDYADGTLILLRQTEMGFAGAAAAKLIAHWLLSAVPLILSTPILALFLAMDEGTLLRTMFSLLLGTPALAAFGTVGAAITVSIRNGGLAASILIAPLSVPVLIFGVGSISGSQTTTAQLFLAALSLVVLAFAPFVAALAITSAED